MTINFNSLNSLSVFGKEVTKVFLNDKVIWHKETKTDTSLSFTAVDAGAVVQLECNGTNLKSLVFQTSTDGQNWTDHSFNSSGMLVNSGTSAEFVLPNVGDRIYFRAKTDNTGITRNNANYLQFTTTQDDKLVDVSGNVMSLLSPEFQNLKQVGSAQFFALFNQNKSIRECDKLILPATTLATYCYSYMFNGCSSLTQAPELPATTLVSDCYSYMFEDCTSLTSAPGLPATTLADYCYQYMFQGCSSLSSAPELPATTLATYCYSYMFNGCSSLTQAPELPATTLVSDCYIRMFSGCTSLETAPTLPATTLAIYCYQSMFYGCSSLTQAPELPATTLAGICYSNMFSGCTSLETAPTLPATTLATHCYSYMFNGCTSLSSAPELPATTLAGICYSNMFNGCTSLSSAPELPATTLANNCYQSMFQGCTSLSVSEQPKEGRTEWMIPSDAITAPTWNYDMFANTGGDFTGNPVPGVKYYIGEGKQDKKLVLKSVNGVECDFDPNDEMIDRRLTYKNIDGVVQQPYSSNPEISGTNSVVEVYDSGDLSSVGAYSFKDCTNLSSVCLKGATEIRFKAFFNCTELEYVDIPTVSTLMSYDRDSEGVFFNCNKLTSINCLNIENLDLGTFNRCKSLISIDLPKLQKINSYVFQGCNSLSSINIPSVTRLESYCFMGCQSLTSLEIPKVNYIGGFSNCHSLSILDFSEKTDDTIPILPNVNGIRGQLHDDFRIIIPERLYDNWISANQWNIISSHIEKAI